MPRNTEAVITGIVRLVLIAAVLLLAISVLGGSVLAAPFDALRERAVSLTGGREKQSASQISYVEFRLMAVGSAPEQVRERVGEPEATSTHQLEGIEVECWLYGAAGNTGAYQLCFANDRLRAKYVFAR